MNKKTFKLSIFDYFEKYCIKIIQNANDLNIAIVHTMIKRPIYR